MDIAAYMSQPLWKEVTAQCGQTDESLLGRYDIICHLVTAADGAPEHYTTAVNQSVTSLGQHCALFAPSTFQCLLGWSNAGRSSFACDPLFLICFSSPYILLFI